MKENENVVLGAPSQPQNAFTLKLAVVENGVALKPLTAKATGDKENLITLLETFTTALQSLGREGGLSLPEPKPSTDNAVFHSGN